MGSDGRMMGGGGDGKRGDVPMQPGRRGTPRRCVQEHVYHMQSESYGSPAELY